MMLVNRAVVVVRLVPAVVVAVVAHARGPVAYGAAVVRTGSAAVCP